MSENNDNMKLITEDQIKEITPEEAEQEIVPAEAPKADVPAKASGKKGKKKSECPVKKTTIGGQALIEGVMMVGPSRTAMAVRKGDGTIYVEEIKQSEKTTYFEKVPFVRGCIRFYKMLVTGTGALMKAADISEEGHAAILFSSFSFSFSFRSLSWLVMPLWRLGSTASRGI